MTWHSASAWTGPAGESPLHDYSGGGNNGIFVLKLTQQRLGAPAGEE